MKVALIHIRYIFKGGLETRLFNYIDYFLERGDEVHLFTSKISPDVVPPPGLHIHMVNLKWIPKPIRNFFFNKKLKRVLKRKEFDFILSLERTSRQFHVIAPSTHKGYLMAKNSVFYDLVDMLQIYLDKKAFASAKVVYACSIMVKEEIQRHYKIKSPHLRVLYPPVNLAKFNALVGREEARQIFNFDADKKYFVLVSTSHKRKGLDLLLEVFAMLPDSYQLVVAGTSFQSKLANVQSLGFVKNVDQLYRAADFLVHPAVYEPFGQIITEAFACRLPVIVSMNVGAKELVNETNGIVVPNLDLATWLKCLEESVDKTFSFEGVEAVLADLSLEEHMNKMLKWALIKK
jgi:glycosyltransferase involved in cell wall biosynthesis